MRNFALVAFASAISFVACGPASKPAESPIAAASTTAETSASTTAAPKSGGLVIKESTFTGGHPPKTITLRGDGNVEGPDGKVKATLNAAGQLIGATSGKVVASIDPSGKVTLPDGGGEVTIDEDGTIHAGADTVKLLADGTLEGDKSGSKILVSDPSGRRAAMFVVFVLTLPKTPPPK